MLLNALKEISSFMEIIGLQRQYHSKQYCVVLCNICIDFEIVYPLESLKCLHES